MNRFAFAAGAIACLGGLSPALRAQDFVASGLVPSATFGCGSTTATVRADGSYALFDGGMLQILGPDGTPQQTLVVFPTPTFPSFIVEEPDGATLLFGESTNGGVWEYTLPAGPLAQLATLPFNYDAVIEPGGAAAVVSAATCGYGCGNSLVRVDLVSGATTVLGSVAGPSGPVDFDVNGDLLYGVQSPLFPAPPGSFSVVRFPASLLASGTQLSDANAQPMVPALDGAADITLDERSRDLVVVESVYGGVSRVRLFRNDGLDKGVLASSPDYLGGVGLHAGNAGPGAFQPYAIAGSRYTYSATDFIYSRLSSLVPVRPLLAISGPGATGGGQALFTVAGGVPNGTAVLIACSQANWSPVAVVHELALFQLYSGLPVGVGNVRRGPMLQLDAAGNGSVGIYNPLSSTPHFVLQALVRNAQAAPVGGSNEVPW